MKILSSLSPFVCQLASLQRLAGTVTCLVGGLMLLAAAQPAAAAAPVNTPIADEPVTPEISIEQPEGVPLVTGHIVAWGFNSHGQTNVPAGMTGVVAIAGAEYHSVALKSDSTVASWGLFNQGAVPAGLTNVTAIAAGDRHTVTLRKDGTIVAWGNNDFNQATVPAGLTGVVAIAAGGDATVALKSDGTVTNWGYTTAAQPPGLTGVSAIAAGVLHTVALKSNGTVVAWGRSDEGQTDVPVGLTDVVAIAAGGYHSVALKSDGTVVSWGPTSVPDGLPSVMAIAAGGDGLERGTDFTLVALSDGTIAAWGDNSYGQINVPAFFTGVRTVAAGGRHCLALLDSSVNFGDQALGTSSAAKTFTIKSTGSGPVSITN